MKKTLFCLLLLSAWLLVLTAAAQTASFSVSSAQYREGEEAILRVTATDVESPGGLHLRMIYDPQKLTCSEENFKCDLPGFILNQNKTEGVLSITWQAEGENDALSGEIFSIGFTALQKNKGDIPVTLEVVELYDSTLEMKDISCKITGQGVVNTGWPMWSRILLAAVPVVLFSMALATLLHMRKQKTNEEGIKQ